MTESERKGGSGSVANPERDEREMKGKTWRAKEGESSGCGEGREKESVVKSR